MKKILTKILSVMLIVCITLTSAPLSGLVGLELPEWLDFSIMSSAATSGTCGEKLTWTFDETTGALTISGSGKMNDYKYNNQPWEGYENSIKKVIINKGVTSIADYAFHGCYNLKSVTMPNSVTSIGTNAFYFCGSLTSVTIPNSVTSIEEKAFDNCGSLISITVDSANKYYSSDEYGVLFNKDKTILIQYPIGNTRKNYTIPGSVASIEDWAFHDCGSLTTIIIPDSVTSIGHFAFYYCDRLTSITIPDSVTSIGGSAFEGCDRLTSITIPDSVTSIYGSTFDSCDNLTSITVDSANKYYSSDEYGVLFNKDKSTLIKYPIGNTRTSYIIPDSVTSIGSTAFQGCDSLTSVTIGDSVTSIGYYAFSNCDSLTSVTIGDSVTSIGYWSFYSCDSLTDVYYLGTEDEWKNIIGSSNEDLTNVTIHYNYCFHNYESASTLPTCTGQGYTTYTCSECGDTYIDNYTDALGHTDGDVVEENYVAPTCTANGSKDNVTYCTVCNVETSRETVTISALGHNIITDETVAPDCTNTGLTAGEHCSRCDYKVEQTVIEALGHKYDTVITVPTCTERGYTTYTCSVCGDTYISDYVDALGHTDGDVVEENYVAPTCSATGSKDNVTYCTVCNVETSREKIMITALGHDIITDEAVAPDCINTGLTAGEHCSRCDYKVEQTVVDALGHKYYSVITAPTCTSQGFTTYTCHCGDTYTSDYVDASGHNYKDGICVDCDTPDPAYFTFEIQQPSRTTIRCNDGIKLHTKIIGNLSDGARIEWSADNGNFDVNASASGNEITIISKNNGYTTFTATVYDADNNVIAQDTIEMYSKAGLFDKIGGFFRSIFGGTKIHEN